MRLTLAHPPGRSAELTHAATVLLDCEVTAREEPREDAALTLDGEQGAVPVAVDDLERAFVLATGGEAGGRDAHGRHVAPGPVDRPLLDEQGAALWADVLAAWPRAARPRPSGRTVPSHDVDWPHSPERTTLSRLRRIAAARRDVGEIRARLVALAGRRDPNDTFDEIMDLSEARGLRSTFFFIAGGTPPRDGDYDVASPPIRALLRRIHERGHEIGLHGSYDTMDDAERLRAEFDKLRRVCESEGIEQDAWGGRQHYLRWDPATTWRAYEEVGLDYDSSAAYADRAGFRLGTSRELPAFDVRSGRTLRLRERPLVAMEVTLIDRMHLDAQRALDVVRNLKERALAHGGDFTLLWHNSRLVSPRERALYEAALDA